MLYMFSIILPDLQPIKKNLQVRRYKKQPY